MEATNYDRQDESDVDQKKDKFSDQGSQNYKHIFELQNQMSQQHMKSSPILASNYSSQIQCMQEEILQLRAQVALLQSELACQETKLPDHDRKYDSDWKAEDENDKSNYTSDDLCETADIFDVIKQQDTASYPHDPLQEFSQLSISKIPVSQSHMNSNVLKSAQVADLPVPKLAERVKLKRTNEENFLSTTELTDKEVSLVASWCFY